MRGLESKVTRRRKDSRGTVWRLSKLTTHCVGTPSSVGVSSSSETKPRRVLVRAATTTDPMRSATGSRVNTSTGLSPPGVAANQISPRCIVPVRPILGWPPVGNTLERPLGICEWRARPCLGIMLAAQIDEMPMEGVAKDLRAIHPKRLRPALNLSGLGIRHAKAKHRHTADDSAYDDELRVERPVWLPRVVRGTQLVQHRIATTPSTLGRLRRRQLVRLAQQAAGATLLGSPSLVVRHTPHYGRHSSADLLDALIPAASAEAADSCQWSSI
jgi:hypothetical protein